MFKNYFITAVRNMKRNKTFSLMNISGLAVGIAGCVLILFYVQYELSYDKCHLNSRYIYRVLIERNAQGAAAYSVVNPPAFAPALKYDYPEIDKAVRLTNIDNPAPLIIYEDKRFYEKQLFFADPEIFELFTFDFIQGDPGTALKNPNSLVITEKTAAKYFGSRNPVGKTLKFSDKLLLEVTGVIKNPPANSTIRGDLFVSFSSLENWLGKDIGGSWQNNMCAAYIMLKDNISSVGIEKSASTFINKHYSLQSNIKNIRLQPLEKIHLYSKSDYNISSDGDIVYIYALTIIAAFILLIASFNYLNLRISQALKRYKEIGVRKAIGASVNQLGIQLFIEGVFYAIFSLVIASVITAAALPYLNDFTGINDKAEYLKNWRLFLWPALISFSGVVMTGSYPLVFLKKIEFVKRKAHRLKIGSINLNPEKLMIAVQFALTSFLIAGSLVIYTQLEYMHNKNLGLAGDQVMIVPIRSEELRANQSAMKERLEQIKGIRGSAFSALLPGGPVGKAQFGAGGAQVKETMAMLWVDHNFNKTLGIQMLAGRDFSPEYSTDAAEAFIINEAAAGKLGFTHPADAVNKQFEISGGKKGKIIGVAHNFHFASMQNKIEPLVMHIWPWMNYMLIRIDPRNTAAVINEVKTLMSGFEPGNPFEYKFLSDNFSKYYEKEERLIKAAGAFTIIAFILAGFGLFSLSANILERKIKEITIRKVLGASTQGIFYRQIAEPAVIIGAALAAALPAVYWVMSGWLANYAYHAAIGAEIFITVIIISFAVLFLMAGYHAFKAAKVNPAERLRYE